MKDKMKDKICDRCNRMDMSVQWRLYPSHIDFERVNYLLCNNCFKDALEEKISETH